MIFAQTWKKAVSDFEAVMVRPN